MTETEMVAAYAKGSRVRVASHDHVFEGVIIMVGRKRDGVSPSCAVENDDRVIHVHKPKHLEVIS